MGRQREDLTGQTFNELTAIRFDHADKGGNAYWVWRCSCGTEKVICAGSVKKGDTKACGHLEGKGRQPTHGYTDTKEFRAWSSMKTRCYNPKCENYPHYGGRGITVCDRWRESFEAFLDDLGPAPSPEYSIDRIDNDGNYEPGNVRWATLNEQCNNRRTNQNLGIKGISKTVTEWAKESGLSPETITWRVKAGWPDDELLMPPSYSPRAHRPTFKAAFRLTGGQ